MPPRCNTLPPPFLRLGCGGSHFTGRDETGRGAPPCFSLRAIFSILYSAARLLRACYAPRSKCRYAYSPRPRLSAHSAFPFLRLQQVTGTRVDMLQVHLLSDRTHDQIMPTTRPHAPRQFGIAAQAGTDGLCRCRRTNPRPTPMARTQRAATQRLKLLAVMRKRIRRGGTRGRPACGWCFLESQICCNARAHEPAD